MNKQNSEINFGGGGGGVQREEQIEHELAEDARSHPEGGAAGVRSAWREGAC